MSDARQEIPATCNLAMREGSSDKVFNLTLTPKDGGWVVGVTRGRRGSTLITDTKTPNGPVSYDKALAIFDKVVKEKIGSGYKVAADASAPAYLAPEGREQTGHVAMLLNEASEEDIAEALDSDIWCAQEKMDGRRMIIAVEGGVVTAVNRRGQVCGLPTGVADTARRFGKDFVVDGECVGEVFHAFDLMAWAGRDLKGKPYRDRLDALQCTVDCQRTLGAHWAIVDTSFVRSAKQDLMDAVSARGGEGVVFKRLGAGYAPGRPASGGGALKHKYVKTLSAIVTAVNDRRSVALGLFSDAPMGAAVPMGNVTVPANQPIPQAGDVVEVRYLYAHRGGALYQPVLLGIRDDLTPQDCTLSQVKYRQEPAETFDNESAPGPRP